MFKLKQNTENTVILTLNENVTISNPFYLLKLQNDLTKDITNLNIINTSIYDRYDAFKVILTGSTFANSTSSTISLNENGMYSYEVYEASASTLNVSATTGNIIEQGKCWVYDGVTIVTDNDNIFYDNNNNNNENQIISYNG